MEHFGTTNNMKSPAFIKKLKESNKEKYGVEWITQLESTKQAYKNKMQELYGVDNIFQTPECIQKIKEKRLAKTQEQLDEIQQKAKRTINDKYGVDNVFQDEQIKQNILNKRYDRQYENFKRFKDVVIPLFSREEYDGDGYYNKKYKWKCLICGNEFVAPSFSCDIPRCLVCYPKKTSKYEAQLAEFCKQYFPFLLRNDRKLITPLELDVVIPEINLAIEFNGIYWHSIEKNYSVGYHLNKTQLCESNGYRLIHIWEDDWKRDTNLIKSNLISIFENKEIIDISKPLDRCWYSILQFKNYTILPPEIIRHENYTVENCGYLIVKE